MTSKTVSKLLAQLESLEAQQINLGLYSTTVTSEELYKVDKSLTLDEIKDTLRELIAQREVIEWKPNLFRSRIAETVRLLRLVRQRLWKQDISDAALMIEDIRVEFRQRHRPKRNALFLADVLPARVSLEIRQPFLDSIGFKTVSNFQGEALKQIFSCAEQGNVYNTSYVVAGDTGAGKTEAFLFPILLDIACEESSLRRSPGVRAVLVYPRIRLARNQLRRMLKYTTRFHASGGPRISFGIQNGDVPSDSAAITKRWKPAVRNDGTWYRVEMLEGCVECSEGRYWVNIQDIAVDKGCPSITCDSCQHTIDSLYITQSSLANGAPDVLIITDVSLSQWLAREKYTHLWGTWNEGGEIVTIPPRFLVLDEVHLYDKLKGAHVARLIKRFQARVRLVHKQTNEPDRHPIVIGVSATLHNEQRFLAKLMDVDPLDEIRYGQLQVIKPSKTDLEETEGRERYIFIYPRSLSPTPRHPQYRVNDQAAAIQIVMTAMHNLKTEDEWRGLAFFDSINDLRQFRHNYDADPSLQWIAGYDQRGKEIPPANQDELWRIRTDRYRGSKGSVSSNCGLSCEERLRTATLHQCSHFLSGDCWVLAKTSGWNKHLRVADSVYAGSNSHGTASQLDKQDLIPASPSLEVGYDDDAIQLVYQHKAPPNAASFIQRRGRAGRDPDDSPIIITLLWPYRRDDAFYFFHPEALYDPSFDDVPLNSGNFTIQRTHTLLAFFDLLACLRRQNIAGIGDELGITDFTNAGNYEFPISDDVVKEHKWRPDPKRAGQELLFIKHRLLSQSIWISGRPIEKSWVRDDHGQLLVRGWLAMDKDLTHQVLKPSWERLSVEDLFSKYLALSDVASEPFRMHYTYPFLVPSGASLPSLLLNRFGNKHWHSNHDKEKNWLKTYRHIDWMLQGSEEATTLTVHYPNLDKNSEEHEDEPDERTMEVSFGLTELLPGNVSYRLRENRAIHWTPIPRNGDSTFLFPEEDTSDLVTKGSEQPYQIKDITSKPDSIFGVSRYLDDRFPGLPFMTIRRLQVKIFGLPNQQHSPNWVFVPDPHNYKEGHVVDAAQPGVNVPEGAIPVSRRSSARASSIIIPYVASSRRTVQRTLSAPLNTLFGAIDGFLEGGAAVLGYTRVFYELQIDVKTAKRENNLTLRRAFYQPKPELDVAGQPKPILVGYDVETQGIRFQVNPDILGLAVERILEDESLQDLRFHLRRNFAAYLMAPKAAEWDVFIKAQLDQIDVAVDYWLHQVVPQSLKEPRFLDFEADLGPLLEYYRSSRIVRKEDVEEFGNFLERVDTFFRSLNEALRVAFKETSQFRDFTTSVLLHSLSALLKNLVARLGGVSSDDLVAYADLPLLDQVDRSIDPRILIMDTVEGGSGGIAQAFDRLDLTDNEGSLWWTLQTELGNCPVGNGEALVRTVLMKASPDQIKNAQEIATPEAMTALLRSLEIDAPGSEISQMLGRILFRETEISGKPINPALILQELFSLQEKFDNQVPGNVRRVMTVRRTVANLDSILQPSIFALREALDTGGVAGKELDHELALQLLDLYNSTCEDGCPVCLSATSDVEHYYLSPRLNSRRALRVLREVLLGSMPQNDCLASLADTLLTEGAVQVQAQPGALGNRLDPQLGLGVVTEVDETGQVSGASTVVVNPDQARDFIINGKWEIHWSAVIDKPYTTPAGVSVRSSGEYIIATMLEVEEIAFEYEPSLPFREDGGKTRCIHPSFLLYEHGLYIEYWGQNDAKYIESRRFKEQVYSRADVQRRIRVLFLEAEDLDNNVFMNKILTRIEDDNLG
jgi:hypothetical protein